MGNGMGAGVGRVRGRWLGLVVLVGVLVFGPWSDSPAAAQDPTVDRWNGGLFGIPGVDGTVHALAVWDDGHGPAVYAGGRRVSVAGRVRAQGIARWDGRAWSALGDGEAPGLVTSDLTNGGVDALAVFDDGSGQALYVGGRFESAGGRPIFNIARWDGRAWSAVGPGLSQAGDRVGSLAVYDDGSGPALYAALAVAGESDSRLMRWDGSRWEELLRAGPGISMLAVADLGQGPRLMVGGTFETIAGIHAPGLAAWNGRSWSGFGAGLTAVRDVEVFDDGSGPALYATGSFERSGPMSVVAVARWDGAAWNPVGDLIDGDGLSLHAYEDDLGPALYAGGTNLDNGILPRRGLLRWDGHSWSLPGGDVLGSRTRDMVTFVHGGERTLIAAGQMHPPQARRQSNVARFARGRWGTLGAELGALDTSRYHRSVRALERFDDGTGEGLYVGGQFAIDIGGPDQSDAFQLARWDADGWSAVDRGVAPDWPEVAVTALKASTVSGDNELYIGGDFTVAGGVEANAIVRWDGRRWMPLGSGLTGGRTPAAYVIEEFDDGAGPALFVGGAFTQAGDAPAAGVARWDGQQWNAVGSGIVGTVYTLAWFDDGSGPALYAGGAFVLTDHPGAGDLARWNGAAWEPVGIFDGPFGSVRALRVIDLGDGPALYAGGWFEISPGDAPVSVARWDDGRWTSLDADGPRGPVRTLEAVQLEDGTELVAAGLFIGGASGRLKSIARWNGSRWASLGQGLGADPQTDLFEARTLATFDDRAGPALFVGGDFFTAGPHISPSIARWSIVSCPADLDADGVLTVFDFLTFLNLYDAGDARADFDGDGELTVMDFLAFQNAFDSGCA